MVPDIATYSATAAHGRWGCATIDIFTQRDLGYFFAIEILESCSKASVYRVSGCLVHSEAWRE